MKENVQECQVAASMSSIFTLSFIEMTTRPKVVRIARRKGVVVQDCDVYIGRSVTYGGWNLPRSKWANPFSVKDCGGSVAVAVQQYREYILKKPLLLQQLAELDGKTLGCWCKPGLCHGDVLVDLFEERVMMKEV